MAKLNYSESLGCLLNDLGEETAYVIGDSSKTFGIHWIALNAHEIDREVTTHPSIETPLQRISLREDKERVNGHPTLYAKNGDEYMLLSAKFDGKEIALKCNVVKGDCCQIEEITVKRLREILDVAPPNWLRRYSYNRRF